MNLTTESMEWAYASTVQRVFGICKRRLLALRKAGLIRWKKLPNMDGRQSNSSRSVYSVKSIREWLDSLPDGKDDDVQA